MKKIQVKIVDPIGLHARPASILVQTASKFSSDIKLIHNERTANVKSIMSVMALAVKKDETIEIQANGADEDQAIDALNKAMVDNKLI